MQIAATYDPEGFRDRGFVQAITDAGAPAGPARAVADLEAEVGALEAAGSDPAGLAGLVGLTGSAGLAGLMGSAGLAGSRGSAGSDSGLLAAATAEPGAAALAAAPPRWIWPATADIAPALLRRGVRVDRCHDLSLTEALLLAYEGRCGEPRSLGAAWARLHGLPVPQDRAEGTMAAPADSPTTQPALFEPDRSGLSADVDPLRAVREVYADQLRRISATANPGGFRLLVAAESAASLAAAEMAHHGLPWRADVHSTILEEVLGPRPPDGSPPREMAAAAARLAEALGVRALNPDSAPQVTKAFSDAGVKLPSLRRWELEDIDHPAIPLLLKYKELSRLYSFNGWAWRDTWVVDGRFRPEYSVGGVVTGRWAARGGGALQIARRLRKAVIADPGWVFVAADAAQLEPRILAAMSQDAGMAEATQSDDMYAALAGVFEGSREQAKIGLLGAMYGQTGGGAAAPLALMRRRFPKATALLDDAAREGERGRLVRSQLGRTCPPPSERWQSAIAGDVEADAADDSNRRSGQVARARGRFTRNFVIQATAAEWAEVLLALLRQRLRALDGPQLVFFQHDEVLVHAPREHAPAVAEMIVQCATGAGRLVFGPSPVRFPMSVHSVECYGDAK